MVAQLHDEVPTAFAHQHVEPEDELNLGTDLEGRSDFGEEVLLNYFSAVLRTFELNALHSDSLSSENALINEAKGASVAVSPVNCRGRAVSVEDFDFGGEVPPLGEEDHHFPVDRPSFELHFETFFEGLFGSVVNSLLLQPLSDFFEVFFSDEVVELLHFLSVFLKVGAYSRLSSLG